MATKKARYMISVDDEMYKAIEDFHYENRFRTRSEATTELIRRGLESLQRWPYEQKNGQGDNLSGTKDANK